jgi:CrcB protein
VRIATTVGFVGAYTTFSTFAYESLRQVQDGALGLAVLNVGASVMIGVAAAWIGVVSGRAL